MYYFRFVFSSFNYLIVSVFVFSLASCSVPQPSPVGDNFASTSQSVVSDDQVLGDEPVSGSVTQPSPAGNNFASTGQSVVSDEPVSGNPVTSEWRSSKSIEGVMESATEEGR